VVVLSRRGVGGSSDAQNVTLAARLSQRQQEVPTARSSMAVVRHTTAHLVCMHKQTRAEASRWRSGTNAVDGEGC
jgi:hypothetical protein